MDVATPDGVNMGPWVQCPVSSPWPPSPCPWCRRILAGVVTVVADMYIYHGWLLIGWWVGAAGLVGVHKGCHALHGWCGAVSSSICMWAGRQHHTWLTQL